MADSAEPPRSVEEVKAMLETTEKGGFRNSMSNCLTVFQCDPLLSGAVAYNLLTDRTDILKPIGYKRTAGSPMTDTDMKYIRLYLEKTYGLTSEKKIQDAADLAANENSYHPVRDYLNGLTWDGTERIRSCLRHFLGAGEDEYTFQSLRLFLLGAIHRAFSPGCKFEVMLCLVGGQGAGKSTFFRLLAVKEIFKNPQRYGFLLKKEHLYSPIPYKEITVTPPIANLSDFAKQQGITYAQLRDANPWLREQSLKNRTGKTYVLQIPTQEGMYYDPKKTVAYNKHWVID